MVKAATRRAFLSKPVKWVRRLRPVLLWTSPLGNHKLGQSLIAPDSHAARAFTESICGRVPRGFGLLQRGRIQGREARTN